jgi:hypothetical protein
MVSNGDAVDYRAMLPSNATLGCIALEAAAALAAGIPASSVALVSVGLYSIIELCAGVASRWRFPADLTEAWREAVGRMTRRLVGFWSLTVGAGVVFLGVRSLLLLRDQPGRSVPGVVILGLALIVMSLVARAKPNGTTARASRTRGVGGHAALGAILAGIALAGVALNVAFGWWWADPVAALAMVPIIATQGAAGFRRSSLDSGRT